MYSMMTRVLLFFFLHIIFHYRLLQGKLWELVMDREA